MEILLGMGGDARIRMNGGDVVGYLKEKSEVLFDELLQRETRDHRA